MFFEDPVRRGDKHFQNGNLEKAADFYVKGESYEQAARLYEKINLVEQAVEAYDKAGLFVEAGDLLEREGRPREAVSYFERGASYRRAAEACERAGASARAGPLFEKADMFDRAARSYADAHQLDNALRALGKERERLQEEQFDETLLSTRHNTRLRQLDLQRVELLVHLERREEAARILLEANLPERAAAIFEKAGDLAGAAESYLALSRPEAALRVLQKLIDKEGAENVDPELRARVFYANHRYFEAGEILAGEGKTEDAARAFEEGGALVRAAELWEEEKEHGVAADLYWRAQRFAQAGRNYAAAGQPLKAGEAFARAAEETSSDEEAVDLHGQAAAAYIAAERDLEAGRQYLQADQPEDAIRVLQDVRESDPDYGQAVFLLILALIDAGVVAGARDRIGALKSTSRSSGGDLSRSDILYAEGRIFEADGKLESARRNYELVISKQFDYRDAGRRLARIDAGERQAAEARSARRSESRDEADRRRSTGSRPQAGPSLPDTGSFELPVKILDRLEEEHRWWDGAEFLKGADPENGDPKLLVSFPLAQVGERVDGFRVAMRTVGGVRHQAVLRLEDTWIASDKVVLVYEGFDGVPLGSILRQGHVLEPLDALRLVLQLNEALINAHKLGVTHQWLSPRTVLVGEGSDQRCKMVGLGLREFLSFGDDDGSIDYVAPEVLDGGVVGPAADAFSSGRLAMDLFGAHLPTGWQAGDELDPDAVGWPASTAESIPSSSLAFLSRALHPDALRRPSVQEVTVALSAAGLLEGQLLDERYEVRGELGRGGMSRVYGARDTLLDDIVAIKTVITPALGRSDDEERLLREVQISRRISHDNVVRVHDLGRFPGGIFVIMELLDGPGLDEVIAAEAPMPLERTRRITQEIARALDAAHQLQIVHRDLKPGNVILVRENDGASDKVKVLDFGIARMNDDSANHLTRTGEVIGSPLYMSPEQIQGLPLEGTCDLYALGVILYAMLTGSEPFHAETPTAVIFKHLNEPPPDIRQKRASLPDPWAAVLDRLLAKKPQDRYQTAGELLAALDDLPTRDDSR